MSIEWNKLFIDLYALTVHTAPMVVNNVKKLRSQKQMSQSAVARGIGASLRMFCYLESGERRLTQAWMIKIAKFLEVKPSELIDPAPTGPIVDNDDTTIWEITRLAAEKARDYPKLNAGLIAAMGMTIWREIKTGKIEAPTKKSLSKKPVLASLEVRLDELIAYEQAKLLN